MVIKIGEGLPEFDKYLKQVQQLTGEVWSKPQIRKLPTYNDPKYSHFTSNDLKTNRKFFLLTPSATPSKTVTRRQVR